jgi:hypothetical protein
MDNNTLATCYDIKIPSSGIFSATNTRRSNNYLRHYSNEMGGACSADGEGRSVYRVLVGKHEGERETTGKTET